MKRFARRLWGAIRRVIPGCVAQTQAIAFNMFLALPPTVVLVLGIVAASQSLRVGLLDAVRPFRTMLPPGLFQLLAEFLSQPSNHPWRLIVLGLAGSLLAGGQMMRLVIDGLQMVYGDQKGFSYWGSTWRALILLAIAIAPWLATTMLSGFARQALRRMTHDGDVPRIVGVLWSGLYLIVTLGIVMAVLAIIYRIGRPTTGRWAAGVPGAAVAAGLWWLVSWAFGVYMRSVHYQAIYGGLEVAIGLMVWMELTATVILIGGAYNAECASSA